MNAGIVTSSYATTNICDLSSSLEEESFYSLKIFDDIVTEAPDISYFNLESDDYSPSHIVFKNDNYTLSHPVDVQIIYTDTVTNYGPKSVAITTYFCVPLNIMNQQIKGDITYNPNNFKFKQDNFDQEFAYYTHTLPVDETESSSWEMEATLYDIKYNILPENVYGEIPNEIKNTYLSDAEQYQISNSVILNALEEAIGTETNLCNKAMKINEYIMKHLYYENDHRWDDAPTVLTQGHGSCTEYSWLYIAMCRAAGIPARYVAGLHYRGGLPYIDTIFHRWTQIYLPNYGWIPVDVTWNDGSNNPAKYFGHTDTTLCATTISGGPSSILGWGYNCIDYRSTSTNWDIYREGKWVDYDKTNENLPPETPTIDGVFNGKIEIQYTYNISSTDSDGDLIYYYVEWGDGTDTGWIGPYYSDTIIHKRHSWDRRGTYQIRVKAKDDWNGFESEWATLQVSMPKAHTYSPLNELILRMLGRFPFLQSLFLS